MRIESFKESFYNLPYILGGKVSSAISRQMTPINAGFAPFPQVVSFFLTEKCNLNCRMCFLKNINSSVGFIPLPVAKRVVRELMPVRPRYSMSGGEPFLYPDIEELIGYIKSRSLSLSIVTNGTNFFDFARFIVHSGVDRLKISVDGPPEIHDKIRGVKGTFSLLRKGIEEINKEKNRQGKRKPRLILYSLLHSAYDPDFILSFAEEYGFDVVNFLHILSILPEDLKRFGNIPDIDPHYWKGAVFSDGDFRVTAELLCKIKSIDTKIDIIFTPGISVSELEMYYEKNQEYLNRFIGNCSSPWTSVYIKPPSNVEICPDILVGNIENKRFLSVWNSPKARSLRKCIFSGKMLPVCKGCCSYYM